MTLTEQAANKVKAMAEKQSLSDYYLRIAVLGGGCSGFTYDLDFAKDTMPGDTIKEFYGIKITIDPMSICYLEGVDIDYIETFKYSGFQFNNPNATNTCGCGSSFSV